MSGNATFRKKTHKIEITYYNYYKRSEEKNQKNRGGEKGMSAYIAQWRMKLSPVDSREESAVIEYGIQIIISSVLKFVFLFLGFCVGYLKEAVIALLTFAVIRVQANGIHLKSSAACTDLMGIIMSIAILTVSLPTITDSGVIVSWGICFAILY